MNLCLGHHTDEKRVNSAAMLCTYNPDQEMCHRAIRHILKVSLFGCLQATWGTEQPQLKPDVGKAADHYSVGRARWEQRWIKSRHLALLSPQSHRTTVKGFYYRQNPTGTKKKRDNSTESLDVGKQMGKWLLTQQTWKCLRWGWESREANPSHGLGASGTRYPKSGLIVMLRTKD